MKNHQQYRLPKNIFQEFAKIQFFLIQIAFFLFFLHFFFEVPRITRILHDFFTTKYHKGHHKGTQRKKTLTGFETLLALRDFLSEPRLKRLKD